MTPSGFVDASYVFGGNCCVHLRYVPKRRFPFTTLRGFMSLKKLILILGVFDDERARLAQ
jgi:hypothetical protein